MEAAPEQFGQMKGELEREREGKRQLREKLQTTLESNGRLEEGFQRRNSSARRSTNAK